jgi:hypothetical protein
VVFVTLVFSLSGCFTKDQEWEFDQDQYLSPNYYQITYGTDYSGIESLRISPDSIEGTNIYFDGFYVIESDPDTYYKRTDNNEIYQITLENNEYVCRKLENYDSEKHVDISVFEEDLKNSSYIKTGDFPYRYPITSHEGFPSIEIFNTNYSILDFDYYNGGTYYYSIQFLTSSNYTHPDVDESCFGD